MAQVTFRPNAAGSNTNISASTGSAAHYTCVDEETADEETTAVYTYNGSYLLDTFNFANPTARGAVTGITVYARCSNKTAGSTTNSKIAIFTSGQAAQYGSENSMTGERTWTNYSKEWTTNPWTSAAWAWDDLNALEIGVALKGTGSFPGYAHCTQVWIVITYKGGGSYSTALGV